MCYSPTPLCTTRAGRDQCEIFSKWARGSEVRCNKAATCHQGRSKLQSEYPTTKDIPYLSLPPPAFRTSKYSF